MRRTWRGLAFVGLALLGLGGCKSSQEQLKPPKVPEEYVAPPDEKRYSLPQEYPKGTLNQDRAGGSRDMSPPGPAGAPPGATPGQSAPSARTNLGGPRTY
jgi:hypothetical protein